MPTGRAGAALSKIARFEWRATGWVEPVVAVLGEPVLERGQATALDRRRVDAFDQHRERVARPLQHAGQAVERVVLDNRLIALIDWWRHGQVE